MQTEKIDKITLFTIGPVHMFDRTLELRKKPIPYFRNDDFSKMMISLEKKLKTLLKTEEETEVIFLTASGTFAMESTVRNLFDQKDKLLIINGGTFGERFCKIAELLKIPFDVLKVDFEKNLTVDDFTPFEKNEYSGVLINLDETSNGKLYDIEIVEDFAIRHHSLLVVDAISTFLCDPFEMDKHHVDVTIFSSQKGLCISPGLSFVALSRKAQEQLKTQDVGFYANFNDYIQNMKRGQTPFTPAVGVLYEADDITDYILECSLDKWLAKIKDNCTYFREGLKKYGFAIPVFEKSNAITLFFVPNHCAKPLKDYLANKGLYVNPCGGSLADEAIRVTHIGNITKKDYDRLFTEINNFLKDYKVMNN